MTNAMELLRTESFVQLEQCIKENALRQLGFDPAVDGDKLDLYFSPFDTMDFYKALDLRVRGRQVRIARIRIVEQAAHVVVGFPRRHRLRDVVVLADQFGRHAGRRH